MKKETALKIQRVTECDDALKKYGKDTIFSAIGIGTAIICSTLAALRLINSDDYKLLNGIALAVSAHLSVINISELKKAINNKKFIKEEKDQLQEEIINEMNKVK